MITPNNGTPLPASVAAARLPDRASPGTDTQDIDACSFETVYQYARGAPKKMAPSAPVDSTDARHNREPGTSAARHNREPGTTALPDDTDTTANVAPHAEGKAASPTGATATAGSIALAAAVAGVAALPVPNIMAVSVRDAVTSTTAQMTTTVSAGRVESPPTPTTSLVSPGLASVHTAAIVVGLAPGPGARTPASSVINKGNPMDPSPSLSAGPGVGIAPLSAPGSKAVSSPGTPIAGPVAPAGAGSVAAGSSRSAGITTVTTDVSSPQGSAATDAKLGGIERIFVVRENPPATLPAADTAAAPVRTAAAELATGDAGNASASQTSPLETATIGLPQLAVSAGSAIASPFASPGAGPAILRGPEKILAAGGPESHAEGTASPSSVLPSGAMGPEQSSTDGGTGSSPEGGSTRDPRDDGKPTTQTRDAGSASPFNGVPPSDLAANPSAASTETMTNQTADRAQLVQQISRHIESMRQTAEHGEMTMNLTQEHLGALRLTITTNQHGVAARIVVETAQAHQAIEGAKEQLRSALENRGLNLTSLDVSLNQSGTDGQNAFARQQERSQDVGNMGRSRSTGSAPEALLAAPAAAFVGSRNAQGRLDYSA